MVAYLKIEAMMHGPATILIMAKKKAGGGGYFDPMANAEMAMGPMEFEDAREGEGEGEKLGLDKMSFHEAAAKLREIAGQLEKSSVMHGQQAKALKAIVGDEVEEEDEDEPTGEEPMPEPPKAKRAAPAFLKPKPMKY
jgi:hypothetical protein